MKKIVFILNPKAGHGLNSAIEEKIDKVFSGNDFNIEKVYTQGSGHATELSRKAASENYYAAIAVGGDGTVNEVAAGLVNSNTAVGIIPMGSGNGFSNFLKIPHNVEKALTIIKNGNLKTIDSFTVNGRFGINVAGAGFDAYVAHRFAGAGKRGFITYFRLVIKNYFGYQEQEYEIEIDGLKKSRKALLVEIANGAEFGNRAVIAPPALVDDGWLDLIIVRKSNLFKLPVTLYRIFSGQNLGKSTAEYYRGKRMVIRSMNAMHLHIDGEAAEPKAKAEVMIVPQSIKVITN